jgi:hypothetical protein
MEQNPRIAIVAILVTGAVGVAGPLITWRATHDTQQSVAAAELTMEDRADLRRVLDNAVSNLDRASHEMFALAQPWSDATSPLASSEFDALTKWTDRVQFSSEQVLIRLGPESPAYLTYAHAFLQLQRNLLKFKGPPVPEAVTLMRENQVRLIRAQKRFRVQAHELAGSILR